MPSALPSESGGCLIVPSMLWTARRCASMVESLHWHVPSSWHLMRWAPQTLTGEPLQDVSFTLSLGR